MVISRLVSCQQPLTWRKVADSVDIVQWSAGDVSDIWRPETLERGIYVLDISGDHRAASAVDVI